MADPSPVQTWMLRALFCVLVLAILLQSLLPLNVDAPDIPGPDLVLCLVLAWVQRRPDVLTSPIIVGTILLCDFLLMRPPGLWTLIVLIATETLRRRAYRPERTPISVEIGVVTVTIALMMLAQRAVLTLFFVDQPQFSAEFLHFLTTAAAYPIVVAVSVYVFGIRAEIGEDGGLRT